VRHLARGSGGTAAHLLGLALELLRVVLAKVAHAVLVKGEEVARGLVLGDGDEARLRAGARRVRSARR